MQNYQNCEPSIETIIFGKIPISNLELYQDNLRLSGEKY